jgi:hypothetical protein
MAKDACFGDGHWSTLVSLVKNRRALTEFLSAPTINQELTDIEEKYNAEIKDKKKKLKLAAGEQHEEEEADQKAADEDDEEEPKDADLPHMLVGEDAGLPMKEQDLTGDKREKACLPLLSLILASTAYHII